MTKWVRRVDWCAVVAVPVVTLTAFLDPLDAFVGALHYGLGRLQRAAPRVWLAGDVGPRVPVSVRPADHRPRRGSGGGQRSVRPRGRVRP